MRRALLGLVFTSAVAQAQYYYTDSFASYNSGAWTRPQFGDGLVFGGSGLTDNGGGFYGSNGATLVSTNPGGNYNRQEIKATISGFYWQPVALWLGANASGTSGISVHFTTNGFTVNQVSFGSIWQLGGYGVSWSGPTTIRAILTESGVRVVVGSQAFWTPVSGISGTQGISFPWGATGTYITQAQLAAGEYTAPNNVSNLTGQGTPAQADLAWTGASDNAGGSGLLRYNVYRNSVLIGSTFGTNYTDSAVSPGTTYTYTVKSEDYHTNEASGVSVSVQTGSSGNAPDPHLPRQTGVRPLGSYWGAAGENIDMRSGNLNFSLPLLKAQGRHGVSLALGLSYNSQNWRRQNGGTPVLIGVDVGYGFGWRLQAGSVIPIYASPGVISHYIFTDSTGAEYRLDVNDGGYWWGKEGVYVAYDPGTQRLRFMDGTFWDMQSTAATTEPDSGTRYPTRVTDSNGNYITVEYKPGAGQGGVNSSARLNTIKDIRSSPGNAYTFTYNTDAIPHLTSISTSLPTGENYSLAYTAPVGLVSPLGGTCASGCGSAPMLQSINATGPGLLHSFEYGTNSAGEMSKVILPYKGELRWAYQTSSTYPNGQVLREVQYRYLVKQLGAAATTYSLFYDYLPQNAIHAWGMVKDPNGVSEKVWWFETNAAVTAGYALVRDPQDRLQATGTPVRSTQIIWNMDTHQNRYIAATITKLDPGTANEKQIKTEQVLDLYGNLLWSKTYNFNNTLRTHHTFTYLGGAAYAQRFIFNRQLSGPFGGAAYDSYPGNSLTLRSGLDLHDTANYGQNMTTRGNRTSAFLGGGYYTATSAHDVTGFNLSSQNGSTTTAASPDSKNVAPSIITPNGDSTKAMTAGFNSIYQVTSVAGPNGASTSIGYDAYARSTSTTGTHGAVTSFTYDDVNRTKTVSIGSRWVKSYFDGFGRTIKDESGTGATVVSTVETEYDSCGCSPTGKMKRVSRPYAPGGIKYWTTYNYDSQGRVVSVVAPDNASTTAYLYEGNTTRVTSPAGKWKRHEVDVAGNLIKVTEPSPAGGADFVTTYDYDVKNQLTMVTMPRPTGTQVRTFTYDGNGKVLTATNPETGTVTNTYDNATGLLQNKIDAKNQKVTYTYDNYKRVTEIRRYEWKAVWPSTIPSHVEIPEQRTVLVYDANSEPGFSPLNLNGRLAYVETYSKRGGAVWNAPGGGNAWETMAFREMYSYSTGGLMTKKRLKASGRYSPAYAVATDYLETSYTFDNEGRMTGQVYPSAHDLAGTTEVAGASYTYGFDGMGRPNTMPGYIDGVTYNAASQPTAITTSNAQVSAETRAYNVLGQLTSLAAGNGLRFEYDFSGTANDGRITTARTYAGSVLQESIGYQYDSLNRLSSANAGSWSATYGFDGFGNLLTVTPSGAGPSAMSVTVNPATNRVNGLTYDANGNVTAQSGFTGVYDIENRLLEATKNSSILYGYGADNRRIYESKRGTVASNGDTINEYVTYWSGQRIGTYKVRWNSEAPNYGPPSSFVFARVEENLYFGSKPLKLGSETFISLDRLGSVRRLAAAKDYFPYGQENPATTAGDKEKYATYKHDAATDLSYADQRYYATGAGRFMTADPYKASAGASEPGSWNRYAYVEGDPVNYADPNGEAACSIVGGDYLSWVSVTCVSTTGSQQLSKTGNFSLNPSGGFYAFTAKRIAEVTWGAALDRQSVAMDAMPGLASARAGLRTIAAGAFKGKQTCQDFFDAFRKATGTTASTAALMDQAATTAGDIAQQGMILDGASADRPLSLVTGNHNTSGTISGEFSNPLVHGLSQFDGLAVWIRASEWSGMLSPMTSGGSVNSYGLGMLLHEVLHKRMVGGGALHPSNSGTPDPFITALNAVGIFPANNREFISDGIGRACF